IDRTVLEHKGDERWELLPSSALIYPFMTGGIAMAYPQKLMEKVEVVNDTVADRPLVVVQTPFVPDDQAVSVFDPILEGERVTLRPSGYFHEGRPVLYDSADEGLWQTRDDGLTAISGAHKGTRLPLIARLEPKRWGDWSSRNPGGLLVVGADRH